MVPEAELVIDQVDLAASITVIAEAEGEDAAAAVSSAVALGNTATVNVRDVDTLVQATQDFGGALRGDAATNINGAGLAVANATTMANTLTASSQSGDLGFNADQTVNQGSTVTSNAAINPVVGSGLDSAVATSQSAANAAGLYSGFPATGEGSVRQTSNGDVQSTSAVNAPGAWPWNSAAVTTATGNSIDAGDGQTRILLDAVQNNGGLVNGQSVITAEGARTATAATQAAGNTVSVKNEGFYTGLNAVQENDGEVTAGSEITLNTFGVASVSANGVGNAALASNIGASTGVITDQTNRGAVTSDGAFSGGSGGAGLVSATAFGNTVAGYACTVCDGAVINAGSRQVNEGPVLAQARATSGASGVISASAAAAGNSATYEATSADSY